MSSAAAGDTPGTDCGLEDASLHPLWLRNQGQGQTTKAQFPGVPIPASQPGQPFPTTSPVFHPWTPHQAQQSLRGQECEKNHPSICY